MPVSLKARLCLMMFLNYVIWGSWYVTIGTYLTVTLKFTGTEAGTIFGTTALASMISPFFIGLIADRFFSTERVLAALHLIGAVLLWAVTQATSFGAVYSPDAGLLPVLLPDHRVDQFAHPAPTHRRRRRVPVHPHVRNHRMDCYRTDHRQLRVEATSTPFLLAAGASVVMAVYCLTLPHTPPTGKGQKITARSLLGLDALVMLKERPYLVFVITSVLACIPLTFYFSFTNAYLNDVGVVNAAGKMTLGQVSEVGVMLLMPFIFRRITVRGVFILGLLCWSVRYGLLAAGNAGPGVWMFYVAILLHGFCFDFVFMTGQLYTDQEAPMDLRGTAQGFLTFLTYGVGMFIGSELSGSALDFFSSGGKHNWNAFWLSSSAGSFVILLLVALFFRTNAKVETKKA